MKNKNYTTFREWQDALDWANELNRELVPIGTAIGTDVVDAWENEKSRLEINADYFEYMAEGHQTDTYCVIKCYKIVIWKDKTTVPQLEDCDSRHDAFEMFEKYKKMILDGRY
jgi:hypothetical protein